MRLRQWRSGDPNVIANANLATEQVALTARVAGDTGNDILTLSATISTNAQILATASGGNLAGGGDAAKIAPGTIVSMPAAPPSLLSPSMLT